MNISYCIEKLFKSVRSGTTDFRSNLLTYLQKFYNFDTICESDIDIPLSGLI